MRYLAIFFLLAVMAGPVTAADDVLYEHLAKLSMMEEKFDSRRTETGIDFNSREKIVGSPLAGHPRYHLEIEGLLSAEQADSITKAAEMIAALVKPEVDQAQIQQNPIIPGVNADFIDINGTVVALLSYKSSAEDNPYRMRLIILAKGGIYTATMSLHSQDEKDRMGIYLITLAIAMINSNEIDLVRSQHHIQADVTAVTDPDVRLLIDKRRMPDVLSTEVFDELCGYIERDVTAGFLLPDEIVQSVFEVLEGDEPFVATVRRGRSLPRRGMPTGNAHIWDAQQSLRPSPESAVRVAEMLNS